MNTIQITERPDLKTSQILQLIRDKFPVYSYYTDKQLDKVVPVPTETTKRSFLSQQEPDTGTLGMSYNQFTEKCLPVITIREYMLLFLAYYEQTGEYLDKKGWTRTSTLDSGGDLMSGFWNDDRFELNYDDRDDQDSDSGPRCCIDIKNDIELKSERDNSKKQKEGFNIICERCGLSIHIQ